MLALNYRDNLGVAVDALGEAYHGSEATRAHNEGIILALDVKVAPL